MHEKNCCIFNLSRIIKVCMCCILNLNRIIRVTCLSLIQVEHHYNYKSDITKSNVSSVDNLITNFTCHFDQFSKFLFLDQSFTFEHEQFYLTSKIFIFFFIFYFSDSKLLFHNSYLEYSKRRTTFTGKKKEFEVPNELKEYKFRNYIFIN